MNDRQRLEAIVSVVCKYLPPDGISKDQAIGEIISLVDPLPKQEQGEPVAWRNAAIRVGEDLCSVGPFGYYDMTAEQWLDWALSVVTVHLPPQQRTWVGLTQTEVVDLLCDYNKLEGHVGWQKLIYMTEAKLREKNSL